MIAIGNTSSEPVIASTILYVTGNDELPNMTSPLLPRNKLAAVFRIAKATITINVELPNMLDKSDRSIEASWDVHDGDGVRLGIATV